MKQEKKRNPDVRKFVDYAFHAYRKKYQTRLVITGADTANTKRVLITVELERLKQYWDWFLNYNQSVPVPDRDFIIKNATRDIKTFCGHINRIIQQCRIKPQITSSSPSTGEDQGGGEDTVWAEAVASTRAEELFNTMDIAERECRITEIEKRLMETHPGWDRKTYHDTAIAILKSNLEEKSGGYNAADRA